MPPRHTRRAFLHSAAAGALAAASPARSAPRNQPNILYLFSDEHRYQAMSFTETPQVKTPNMKRMATEGFSFDQCVSNYPVCSPYRAMLLTGRWPRQTGVVDNNIPLNTTETTVGDAFKAAGYDTGYIGKWHLGGNRAEPFGFDASLIWTNTNTHYRASKYHPKYGDPVVYPGYNATGMTDQAIDFMKADREKPFFLMVSWNPPHASFLDAPPEFKKQYPAGSIPQRPNAPIELDDERDKKRRLPSEEGYAGYHAHVAAIDAELGRVLAYLEESGQRENTIVLYSSDHGSLLGSHGAGSKRQPFEEAVRVPFLVYGPNVKPMRSDALFGTIDIMPTLCGLAGIPVPETCAGRDFTPWIATGNGPNPDAQLLMHIAKANSSRGADHPAPIFRGIRTARHTYAVKPGAAWCLYDNKADPYQMKNRVDDPERADVRKRLREQLGALLAEAKDPFVLP